MKLAASEQRNCTVPFNSSTSPNLCIGVLAITFCFYLLKNHPDSVK
jgi:hypothetical protein